MRDLNSDLATIDGVALDGLSQQELDDLYQECVTNLQDVERQLTARKPVSRVSPDEWKEYRTWRHAAVGFKTRVLDDMRLLKSIIRDMQEEEQAGQPKTGWKTQFLDQMESLEKAVQELTEEVRQLKEER